jgi:transaldolase/glucose-6-phosphate isomerase
MRIVIGSDHAGFPLKEGLTAYIRQLGHQVVDVGTHGTEPVDYPDYAEALGKALLGGQAERGVLICGSCVGASVAANKVPGIRAGLCHDTYSAHQGVEHDDMNVLVLGGRVIGPELAQELVKAYLGATFTGEERHRQRLEKVHVLEGRLRALQGRGQSVWLDYIRRSLLTSGELARLIEADGLRGVTSNPAIFEKAISGSTDYVEMLQSLAPQYREAKSLYEQVAIRDIQDAADVLRRVYEQTQRRDGYVSLEVSPDLARDTAGTLAEARRL